MVKMVTSLRLLEEARAIDELKQRTTDWMVEKLEELHKLLGEHMDAHFAFHARDDPRIQDHVCMDWKEYIDHIYSILNEALDKLPQAPDTDKLFRKYERMAAYVFERKREQARWACRVRMLRMSSVCDKIKGDIERMK